MNNNDIRILGVLIRDRENKSQSVQNLLTKYGCSIKTRLGLHEVDNVSCSSCGLMILELIGDKSEMEKLENELIKIENVEVQKMIFDL